MTQFDPGTIVASTESGTALASRWNSSMPAIISSHRGASRPSYALQGTLWIKSGTTDTLMFYDGSSDIALGTISAGAFTELTGVVKPYAGIDLPSGFLWCDGSAVSRATYSTLFAAVSKTTTGTTTSGSATIASVADNLTTLGLVGATVEGSGVQSGSVILSVTSSSITLDKTCTANAAGVSLRIFPFGAGNGSTTFNVPDLRGRVPAGRDGMGGSAASRLTSAGSGIDGANLGKTGGAETVTLSTSQIPAHNHTASSSTSVSSSTTLSTDGAHTHTASGSTSGSLSVTLTALTLKCSTGVDNGDFSTPGNVAQGDTSTTANRPGAFVSGTGTTSGSLTVSATTDSQGSHTHTATTTSTATTTTTVNNAGGGLAHNNAQPTAVINYIIKT